MSTSLRTLAASTLLVASMIGCVGTASAAPVVDRLAIKNASPSTIELVQWRGGGWGWGAPVAGALVAGALLGGALAAPYYYGPGPYYYPRPYYAPAPAGYYARAMVLRQVGTRSPTAPNASGRTTQGAELISGQTAIAIHALER
jgi:hypothetical protein